VRILKDLRRGLCVLVQFSPAAADNGVHRTAETRDDVAGERTCLGSSACLAARRYSPWPVLPRVGTFADPRNLLSSQPYAKFPADSSLREESTATSETKECANVLVGVAIQVTTRERSTIGYLVRIAHFLRMKKRAFEKIDLGMSKVARLSRRSQGGQHASGRNLRRSVQLG